MTETTMRDAVARFFYEMREGGRRQGNVLFALIFKELKSREGNDYRFGLYSLLVILLEPALGVAVITTFWYLFRRQEILGINIALFVAVSYTPFGIIRRSLSSIPRSLRGNQSFYSFQQVKPFDAITAQFIIEMVLTLSGRLIMMFCLWWFLDLSMKSDHILQFLGILAMMVVAGFGISLFFGVYGTLFPLISRVVRMMSMGLLMVCAVIHPLAELPSKTSYILSWNPVANMEEYLRLYGLGIKPDSNVSLNYAMGFTLTILFLGFTGYYANRRKVLER